MSPPSATLVHGYTLALGIVTALMAFGAIVSFSFTSDPLIAPQARWAQDLIARLEFGVAAVIGLVTYLRARESRFALGATTALNALFALFFPFGTAAFLYWWFSIRRREQNPAAA